MVTPISSLIGLLLIACIVALISEGFRFPHTVALVAVGLVIAVTHTAPAIHLTHDITFMLILPPLLFHGAMHMDLERLRTNWAAIAIFAIPGVCASTFLIGLLIHWIWGVELIHGLLFGALITPTDPVSVLAILRKTGAPERLRILLEGESLFNDGTGVVIFTLLLGISSGEHSFSVMSTLREFIFVAGGSLLLGAFMGWLVYRILRKIDNHLIEVSLTIVLAFGSSLLAEHLHLSGILTVVIAGLIIGNHGRYFAMSQKTRAAVENFWDIISFIINSLVFLIIGIELQVVSGADLTKLWQPCVLAIITVVTVRAAIIYPAMWFRNRVRTDNPPKGWSHILFWGALKGSIPLALVLGMHDFEHSTLFLTATFSVVLFSLLGQGLTIAPLLKVLGIGTGKPMSDEAKE